MPHLEHLSSKVGVGIVVSNSLKLSRLANEYRRLQIFHAMQLAVTGVLELRWRVSIINRIWPGAAAVLIFTAIIVLGLFLAFRPLQLESPASGSARALLRLDTLLGATVEPVDSRTAGVLGVTASEKGLVVTSVASSGPAADAGIRVGDVIETIGNHPITEVHSRALSAAQMPVLINRGGSHAMLRLDFAASRS